jgi:porin
MKSELCLSLLATSILLGTTVNSSFASCLVHTGDHPAYSDDDPPVHFDLEHNATGDWFGLRNTLSDHGLDFEGSYVNEPAGNPVGGLNRGFTYLHNVALSLDVDLDRFVGIPNTTFLFTVSQRTGSGLSKNFIGNAIAVQQIFGGGETLRLVQMRMEHHFFEDRFTLACGRITATADFFTSPLYCSFVNNGICGQPPAPFFNMNNGITAYPQATWGALAEFNITKETYIKAAVYQGDPNTGGARDVKHGTNFGFGGNGVLLLSEIGYKPEHGLFDMPGRFSLGGYYHTGHFADVAQDAFGGNIFVSGLPGREHRDQEGIYFIFEQMFYRNPDRPKTGLNSFVTFVVSPEDSKSTLPYFFNCGFVYEGLCSKRPDDKTSLGMYSAWWGGALRDAQRAAGLASQTNETDIEFNHQFQINHWFYVRPNIQFVVRPNGYTSNRNALVLGMEMGITF